MRISIITATHKRPTKLKERCLSSILRQTSSAFEWVVINDGEDTQTKKIIDSVYGQIDLKYSGTSHSGLIASRNLGLEIATGDLISFLDDDNIIYPEFVERMLNHFSQHPSISMSMPIRTQRRDIYENDVLIRTGKSFRRPLPDATNEDIVKNNPNAWFDSNGFVHKRNNRIRFNPDTLIMSDYEYLLKCFSEWGIDSQFICQEELVDYVQTSDGIIGTSRWETWFHELEYLWNHRSKYKIFDIVNPEPWLREQMEEAKEKHIAGEDLPGFPRKRTAGN